MMTQTRKRFLWVLLGLTLALALYCSAASAASSGSCGDNLTWTLDDGVLTISGSGTMNDYSYYIINNNAFVTKAPWGTNITSVVIESGVTSIGNYAFQGCTSLTSVTIPDSVTSIRSAVFGDCIGLTSITIPSSVASIYSSAFSGCTSLTSITIPSSVHSIYSSAFSGCTSLTNILVDEGNSYYASIDGVLFNKTITSLHSCPVGKTGPYSIPAGVNNIASYAFSGCTGLTSITIPEGVTRIGSRSFSGCTGLTSITIPESVTSIESYAFSGCTGLTSITIPGRITSINDYTFENCSNLSQVYYTGSQRIWDSMSKGTGNQCLTKANVTCTYINDGTYGQLTWMLSNDGVLTISGYGDMYDYEDYSRPWPYTGDVTSVVINSGVTSIGRYAFKDFSNLVSVSIPSSVIRIGYDAFYRCRKLASVSIEEGLTRIERSAFGVCTSLTSITIPDGVTYIGENAFADCTNLTSITLPASITSLSSYYKTNSGVNTIYYGGTFEQWKSIQNSIDYYTTVHFSDGTYGKVYGDTYWSLSDNGAMTIYGSGAMPTNMIKPWENDSDSIQTISIKSGVTVICDGAFSNCTNLTSISVDAGNQSYTSISGVLFDKSATTLVCCPRGRSGSYTIPATTNSIGPSAFYNCTGLTSVTIPDSITNIGIYAFSGCTGLTSIAIPDSVTSIGSSAFSGCTGLTSVTISDSITSINGFSGCTSLTSIAIPDSVTSVGRSAFSGCTGLTSITIPDSVTSIESYAFSDCTGLTGVVIPDSVTSIRSYAFSGCTGLTSVTIPDSVTSIESYAFSGCTGLTSVTIPDSVTSVGSSAFSGCTSLTDVYYGGTTADEWNAITISNGNNPLTSADIHYHVHDWLPAEYTWSETGTEVTATRVCANNPNHVETETVPATGEVTKEPTCTEPGETTYTSGEFTNEAFTVQTQTVADIPALNHNWDEPTYAWSEDSASVTATHVCLNDSSHVETETVPAVGEMVTEPTCTELGETTYISEAFTNPAFAAQTRTVADIPALGHTPVTDEAVESTCAVHGLTEGSHCAVCGEVFVPQQETPLKEHTYELIKKVPATCEEPGWTSRVVCSVCGDVTIPGSEIPALGHDWSEATYTWSEDNSEVTAARVCSHDAGHVETETVAASSEITKQPTCTEPGETTYTGEAFTNPAFTVQTKTIANIDALGHDWSEVTYTWSEDNSTVTASRVCSHDADHVETETVAVSGEITKQPTCTEPGETTYTSEVFTNPAFAVQTKTIANIDVLGHTPVTDEAVAPTCTEDGLTEGSHCAVCGEILVAQERVPKKGHSYAIVPEVPATCEEAGFTEHVACTVCGYAMIPGEAIPALGHAWSEVAYTWSEDNTEVTAARVCTHNPDHAETETAIVTPFVVSPTETSEGSCEWISNPFENEAFVQQTKSVTIPALNTLSVLRIPAGVQTIEEEAFEGVPAQAILIPDGCTVIGRKAFAGCTNLLYVRIPASVTSIAANAFDDCPTVIIDRIN